MKSISYLINTNIITAILKKNEKVNHKLNKVSSQQKEVFISCITFYEIKRGLLYAKATKKLSEFEQLCNKYKVVLLEDV